MDEKNIDMFKLVAEVEKQKSMNIDDIFSNLDSIKNEEVNRTEDRYSYTAKSSSTAEKVALVKKPIIPDDIGNYDTRFECFRAIIEHVSYSGNNNNSYIEGHQDAIKKYYRDAYNNSKDLYVIEARVNDEINRFTSRSQLYEKGYYDGLFYTMKALKRSKELLMQRINKEINQKL